MIRMADSTGLSLAPQIPKNFIRQRLSCGANSQCPEPVGSPSPAPQKESTEQCKKIVNKVTAQNMTKRDKALKRIETT